MTNLRNPADTRFRRVARSARVRLGAAGTLLVLIVVGLGPVLAPHKPSDIVGVPYSAPGPGVMLGTDYLGQDALSRVLWGGWSVVWMSVAATAIAVAIGAMVGLLAAQVRGVLDVVVIWLNDVLLAFPLIVFVIVFLSMLGREPILIVVLVAIGWLPTVVRLTRSVSLEILQQDYVAVAEIVGTPRWRILIQDVLPNITTPLFVQAGAILTWSIGVIAGLSFLGFGIQPPDADWGLMVNENRSGLVIAPWATIAPIVCIALFALSVNTLADGVGEALGTSHRDHKGNR